MKLNGYYHEQHQTLFNPELRFTREGFAINRRNLEHRSELVRKDASQYAEVHSRDFEHNRGDLRGNRRRSFNLRTGGAGIAPSFQS